MSSSLQMSIRVRVGTMQKIKKQRYTVPDTVRGIAVIMMIVYHAMWDMVYLFGVSIPWFRTDAGFIFQQSICWSFILISGFCFQLGRKKLKRALIVIACSFVLSAVTAIVMPESIIIHGVLSLIGFSMLVTIPLDKILKKIHPVMGMNVSFFLFVLLFDITKGIIGIGECTFLTLPKLLYANTITAFFGFPHSEFFSTDYVPLLPWIFLFLTGYFAYSIFEKGNKLNVLSAFSCKPLEFIGRHSLEIYMIHQPVIYGILFLIYSQI